MLNRVALFGRDSLARAAAICLAGAAALLAVCSVRAQIEDLATVFGEPSAPDSAQRLATAAADCGALGAERETCEIAVLRLAPPGLARVRADAVL